jgi:N-acetylmuramoyl-L-alanine amidase
VVPSPSASARSHPSALPTYGGQTVSWPQLRRTSATPAALGAIATSGHVEPVVLTPCDRHVQLSGSGISYLAPSGPNDSLVVLDPGHGGHADGAMAADGTREADVVLALSKQVLADLRGHVGRVVVTRSSDIDVSLGFRVALADALRADLAVSLHLDANPGTTTSPVPGTQAYAAAADPNGRRAAGVLYQAERRYIDTLSPRVGHHWGARRNRGALYRLGSNGDYYYLLRSSHVTWVISEAMFVTVPHEEALMTDPSTRGGLADAIAGGIGDYLGTHDPGSGWRTPIPQPADPSVPGAPFTCHDPA